MDDHEKEQYAEDMGQRAELIESIFERLEKAPRCPLHPKEIVYDNLGCGLCKGWIKERPETKRRRGRARTMASAIPVTQGTEIAKRFESTGARFSQMLAEIDRLPLNKLNADMVAEYDAEAKKYMEAVEDGFKPTIQAAFSAHKNAVALKNRVLENATRLRVAARTFISRYSSAERQKAEEKRREQEAILRKQQEDARIAEAAHLESLGKKEEAEEVLSAPEMPVSVPLNENAGKVEGTSTVEVWTPAHDDKNTVLFETIEKRQEFLKWAAENQAFNSLLEVKYAPLKKLLSDNKGQLLPPGIRVERSVEIRNRSRE